jgi:hypothetical protein
MKGVVMKRHYFTALLSAAATVFTISVALTAQDKSTARVPNGLGVSDFKGYEGWQAIAPSYTDHGTKVILGNPTMMKAYGEGIPANGKPVPDGAMMAKIEWTQKKDDKSPYDVTVPDTLKSLSFMVKDSKRFVDTGGWGFAKFTYERESNTLKPEGTGTACGYACHLAVKGRDLVFTHYANR